MDNQPGPQDDPVNLQNDEKQHGDPKNITETGKEESLRYPSELSPLPALPRVPTISFSREDIMNEILDLTNQVASTGLYGSIGVGKSFVALAVLHHNRTKAIFGTNCHFMHCDDLANSLEGFLERLSDATGTDRTTDIGQLRSHLNSSPPHLLVLDGVDLILDPLVPEGEEISAIIEESGSDQHVCLVATSRMHPDIHGFHRIEVPTLSEDGARETFYSRCNLDRSSAVDELIASLDFHPLSIDLLARSVRENDWDATSLLQAWDDGQTSVLRTKYQQSLKETLKLSLHSPTVQSLGTTAQDVLNAIAAFPLGVKEDKLRIFFPSIAGVGAVVDILCQFSLVYRQDGFVKMLSPFRFYFLDSMLKLAQHPEVIRWGPDCNPAKACTSLSFYLFCDQRVMAFQGLPIYTAGPPKTKPPRATKLTTFLNVNRDRNPRPKKREHDDLWLVGDFIDRFKELLTLLCLAGGSIDLDDTQTVPVNTPSAPPVQQSLPVVVEAYDV